MNETVMGIQYAKRKHKYKWLLVTNLSTFFDFPKFMRILRGEERFVLDVKGLGGVRGKNNITRVLRDPGGVVRDLSIPLYAGPFSGWFYEHGGVHYYFIAGYSILLNEKSVEMILKWNINWRLVNDVAIKVALKDVSF